MQRFLTLTMALCLSLTLSLDAHAKRFGGGKSFGSSPSHQTTQQRQSQPAGATNTPAGKAPAAASGASRWLGPLAGIAAGGLLASMFMGDGFQGLQLFDMLIFALLAFVLFKLFRTFVGRSPALAGASAGGQTRASVQPGLFGGSSSTTRATIQAPAWFNQARFVEQGREHFLSLQQHWDSNDMDKISEFVAPALLDFLKQERANIGDAYQATYIDELQVQLDGLDDLDEQTIATLTFSGLAKTSRFDQGEAFSESWRMERAKGDNQPWLIAGIRQNG